MRHKIDNVRMWRRDATNIEGNATLGTASTVWVPCPELRAVPCAVAGGTPHNLTTPEKVKEYPATLHNQPGANVQRSMYSSGEKKSEE
jgi:hypothetical protein